MSSETNPDFIFLAVTEMVRCSDVKFLAFWKKNSSKKKVSRETEAIPEVGAVLEGEAISAMPISKMAGARVEVFAILLEVLGDAEGVGEPPRVCDAIEVASVMKAPIGEESPIWAAEVS